jgi:hypothetical protein
MQYDYNQSNGFGDGKYKLPTTTLLCELFCMIYTSSTCPWILLEVVQVQILVKERLPQGLLLDPTTDSDCKPSAVAWIN